MPFTELSARSAGDLVTASIWSELRTLIGDGVARPLADTRLVSAAANVDVTGIPATHRGLLVIVGARSAGAVTDNISIRLNNDTTANYDDQHSYATASTSAIAARALAATAARIGFSTHNLSPSGHFGKSVLFLPEYADTNSKKSWTGHAASRGGSGAGDMAAYMFGGQWRSTAAVNRVTIYLAASNLAAGSRVTIFGLTGGI